MPKSFIRLAAAFSFSAAIITCELFHRLNSDIYLTLAVTSGTKAWHLGMRLLTDLLFNITMKNRTDYTKKWFQTRSWEMPLYQFLDVKSWKNKMPTYNPETFSPKNLTWDEIAQAMCQSELVHETNIALSFVPLTTARWFGSFYVFLLTSIGGCIFDLVFVIMQRYNRARIIKIFTKKR